MKKVPPEEFWKIGTVPTLTSLQGRFTVKILSGPFRPLNRVYSSWEKLISGPWGYNIINKKRACGYFIVSILSDKVFLVYKTTRKNSFLWRRLEDQVKLITIAGEDVQFIGRIQCKLFHKWRFAGYFTLTPIKQEGETE